MVNQLFEIRVPFRKNIIPTINKIATNLPLPPILLFIRYKFYHRDNSIVPTLLLLFTVLLLLSSNYYHHPHSPFSNASSPSFKLPDEDSFIATRGAHRSHFPGPTISLREEKHSSISVEKIQSIDA